MLYIGFSTTDLLISKIIRWGTKSPTSHVFLLFDCNGIEMVFEASLFGTRLVPWKIFQDTEMVVKLTKLPYQSQEVMTPLLASLSTPYDFGGLIGSSLVIFGRWFRKKWTNPWNNPNRSFCSEIVAKRLKDLGDPNLIDCDPSSTTPKDLFDMF